MIIDISNKPNIYGQVGRRVEYTGDMANPAGVGAIVAINEPTRFSPLTADVLLEDGRAIPAVYCSTIVHISEAQGCRHRLLALDEFVTEEDIADLHAKRAMKVAADKAREDAKKKAFAEEVERLKAAHPDLVAGSDRKAAAANIRKLLKQFKGVKFSVTSDHNSVYVRWTDGPTAKSVDEIVSKFKEGYFDGSDDCYKYTTSPWNHCFGAVRYAFPSRECSDELVQCAIDKLIAEHGGDAPSVEDYRRGRLWNKFPAFSARDWNQVIYQQLAGMES